jgi:hypothetical protein
VAKHRLVSFHGGAMEKATVQAMRLNGATPFTPPKIY